MFRHYLKEEFQETENKVFGVTIIKEYKIIHICVYD